MPDALVGAASADVARHRIGDLLVARLRRLFDQRCGLHDLTGLAIPTLGDVVRLPGKLDRMATVGTEALDRDDLVSLGVSQCGQAGTNRLTVNVDGASAASADATTEFGSGKAHDIANGPEQWHLRVGVDAVLDAVDLDLWQGNSPAEISERRLSGQVSFLQRM